MTLAHTLASQGLTAKHSLLGLCTREMRETIIQFFFSYSKEAGRQFLHKSYYYIGIAIDIEVIARQKLNGFRH